MHNFTTPIQQKICYLEKQEKSAYVIQIEYSLGHQEFS